MKQKALNVAVALAFGAVAAPSLAGTISVTPRQFPSTLFGSPSPALAVAPVAYAISAPLAANTTRFFYIKLDNSAKFDGTKVAAGDFKVTDPTGATPTGITIGTPVLSADSTFEVVQITTGSSPVAINSTISYVPAAGAVTNTAALGTPGQQITATASLSSSQNTSSNLADADAASNGPVAISVVPFTVTVVSSASSSLPFASGAGHELSQIDVIGAGAKNGIELTNPADITNSVTALDFGSFKVALVTGLFKADGTSLTVATDAATKATFTISGAFNAFTNTAKGAFFDLSDAAGDVAGTSANVITASTISPSTVTFTAPVTTAVGAGNLAVGSQYYFIGKVDDTTLIDSTAPTVSSVQFTLNTGSATVAVASPSLYSLRPNGGIVTVPTYVPSAAQGYVAYYRVINTGSLTATPSVQVVSEAGVVGASGVLGTAIPAGGVHIFSSSDIEAAVGTVSVTQRPRLRFTATTTIQVQTLLTNPNGTLTTLDTFN